MFSQNFLKRLTLVLILIAGFSVLQAATLKPFVLHPSWYKITQKAKSDPGGFGTPMILKKIEYRGKEWKCGTKSCYTYGITIQRPGNDRGDGILKFGDLPFSIEYWVGDIYPNVVGFDIASTIAGGYDITKIQTKRRELTLVFNKAFVPGRYKLRIAPFPYPTVHGSSLMKFIEYYRHDYKAVADETYKYYKYAKVGHKFATALYDLAGGKVKDLSINTLLITVVDTIGVHVVLDIPAVMPYIAGIDFRTAEHYLRTSSLRPVSKECRKTKNEQLFGKVYSAEYKAGKLLPANKKVKFAYYCLPKPIPNIKNMYTKDADRTLRQSGFIPAPGRCVPTQNKRLDKKVFKYAAKPDINNRVAYKYYCYKELKVESSFSFQQCPKKNPGNRLKNKFDTNNNRKDGNYIICNYFKGGALQYQAPYVNGKKHHLVLNYQNKRPHKLSQSANYKNGQRDGIMKIWVGSGSKYFLQEKIIYKAGNKSSSMKWHSNGEKSTVTKYKPNGRAHLQHNFNKHGKPTYCTEWDDRGYPMDCKTKRYR